MLLADGGVSECARRLALMSLTVRSKSKSGTDMFRVNPHEHATARLSPASIRKRVQIDGIVLRLQLFMPSLAAFDVFRMY